MNRHLPFRPFTLIELLVVVSVIAVLAAMLLPALSRARKAAKNSACINNLRQHGMAMNLFHADYDGLYPKMHGGFSWDGGNRWYRSASEGWLSSVKGSEKTIYFEDYMGMTTDPDTHDTAYCPMIDWMGDWKTTWPDPVPIPQNRMDDFARNIITDSNADAGYSFFPGAKHYSASNSAANVNWDMKQRLEDGRLLLVADVLIKNSGRQGTKYGKHWYKNTYFNPHDRKEAVFYNRQGKANQVRADGSVVTFRFEQASSITRPSSQTILYWGFGTRVLRTNNEETGNYWISKEQY